MPTIVKLAVEGVDGTIWQTRSVRAEKRQPVDSSYTIRFRLISTDMEQIDGQSSLKDVLSDVKNVRIRFENSRKAGFRQDAYIDSIVASQ